MMSGVECVAALWDLTVRWPELTSPSFINPTASSCEAAEGLVEAFLGASGFKEEWIRELQTAKSQAKWGDCVHAALQARSAVWQHLVKPGVMATADQLAFVQSRLDSFLLSENRPLVLAAGGYKAVLRYPCAADARLLGTIADGHRLLSGDPDLVVRIAELSQDPGRTAVDCVMDIWDLTARWPELTSISFVNPTAASCEAGEALLEAFLGASEFPTGIREQLHAATSQSKWADCVRAALQARSAVWQHLAKPGASATADQVAFVQRRLESILVAKNRAPVLAAVGYKDVLIYPCAADARLLGTIMDGHRQLSADPDLVGRVSALFRDPGRSAVDCVMDIWDVTVRWPELTSPSFIHATAPSCEAGEALIAALQGMGELKEGSIREELQAAKLQSKWADCVDAALQARSAVWQQLVKPEASTLRH
jgi:hypothetical protein